MTEEEVKDVTSEDFWTKVRERSHKNSLMYREIFGCDPDDTAVALKNLTELRKKIAEMTPEEQLEKYNRYKNEIKGFVVDYPLHYMEKENLQLTWTQLEGLLPEINFL